MIDELDLVRRSMDRVPDPAPVVVANLRAQLEELIAAEEAVGKASSHRPRRRRRVQVFAVVSVAAAAALIAALLVPGTPDGPAPAVAAALRHEAVVARDQPSPPPLGAGQYIFTSSVSVNLTTDGYGGALSPGSPAPTGPTHSFSALVPVTRDIWIASDGSGRLRESFGAPSFLSPADRAAWLADGSPSVRPAPRNVDDTLMGKGLLWGPDLANLPTDPSALTDVINERKVEDGPPGNAETFTIIGDLLRETDASPALRAALYEVAASLPGVEFVGTVRDEAGRTGTAVAYTSAGEEQELIFNPQTSALLGETYLATDPSQLGLHVSAGTVIGWSTYLEHGVVTSVTATPEGSSIPLSSTMLPSPQRPTAVTNG